MDRLKCLHNEQIVIEDIRTDEERRECLDCGEVRVFSIGNAHADWNHGLDE